MSEVPVRPDTLQGPERFPQPSEFLGLHTRLLLTGSALNPNKKDLPTIEKSSIKPLEERDYSAYNKASASERKSTWQGREGNIEQQRQKWCEDTAKAFQDGQAYFKHHGWDTVFKKLIPDISTEDMTAEHTRVFYKNYIGESDDANIHRFVKDILKEYKSDDGNYDLGTLQNDMPAIKWLGDMFGKNSSAMIQQLMMAEATFQNDPDAVLEQANISVGDEENKVTRVNNLSSDESAILSFIWENGQDETEVDQSEISIRHTRLDADGERTFPQSAHNINHSDRVAASLIKLHPDKYGSTNLEELVKTLDDEEANFHEKIARYGINMVEVGRMIESQESSINEFMKNQYGVKQIPEIANPQLIPLYGKRSELHNPDQAAMGHVNTVYPAIYIDWDQIEKSARHDIASSGTPMTDSTIGKKMMELAEEVTPHEYMHLISDIAVLQYYKDEESLGRPYAAKLGFLLEKPKHNQEVDVDDMKLHSRGYGLNEAMTTDITERWVKSTGKSLAMPVYDSERKVLDTLITTTAKELGETEEEVYKKFAQGFFEKNGYFKLVKTLSGPRENGNYKHPHRLQTVYALMEHAAIGNHVGNNLDYSLTISYLNGTLTAEQKNEIKTILTTPQTSDATVRFTEQAKQRLAQEIGIDLPPPEPGTRLASVLERLRNGQSLKDATPVTEAETRTTIVTNAFRNETRPIQMVKEKEVIPDIEITATPKELEEAKAWIHATLSGMRATGYGTTASTEYQDKRAQIILNRANEQMSSLTQKYASPPPLDAIPDYERQRNPGMMTCQFTSAINALRFLNKYNAHLHTQEEFIRVLGGSEYAREHAGGIDAEDSIKALQILAPDVVVRRSNSLPEILSAVERGAAAVVAVATNHVATIPPGSRVLKDRDGRLFIQTADPLSGTRNVLAETLIKLDIAPQTHQEDATSLIIENPETARANTRVRLPAGGH